MPRDSYQFEGLVTRLQVPCMKSGAAYLLEWKRGDYKGNTTGAVCPAGGQYIEIDNRRGNVMKFPTHLVRDKSGWKEKKLTLRVVEHTPQGRRQLGNTEVNIGRFMESSGQQLQAVVRDHVHSFRLQGTDARMWMDAIIYPTGSVPPADLLTPHTSRAVSMIPVGAMGGLAPSALQQQQLEAGAVRIGGPQSRAPGAPPPGGHSADGPASAPRDSESRRAHQLQQEVERLQQQLLEKDTEFVMQLSEMQAQLEQEKERADRLERQLQERGGGGGGGGLSQEAELELTMQFSRDASLKDEEIQRLSQQVRELQAALSRSPHAVQPPTPAVPSPAPAAAPSAPTPPPAVPPARPSPGAAQLPPSGDGPQWGRFDSLPGDGGLGRFDSFPGQSKTPRKAQQAPQPGHSDPAAFSGFDAFGPSDLFPAPQPSPSASSHSSAVGRRAPPAEPSHQQAQAQGRSPSAFAGAGFSATAEAFFASASAASQRGHPIAPALPPAPPPAAPAPPPQDSPSARAPPPLPEPPAAQPAHQPAFAAPWAAPDGAPPLGWATPRTASPVVAVSPLSEMGPATRTAGSSPAPGCAGWGSADPAEEWERVTQLAGTEGAWMRSASAALGQPTVLFEQECVRVCCETVRFSGSDPSATATVTAPKRADLVQSLAEVGVQVAKSAALEVRPESGSASGVRPGTLLAELDGAAVSSPAEIAAAFDKCGAEFRATFKAPASGVLHVTIRSKSQAPLDVRCRVVKVRGKPPNTAAPLAERLVPAAEEEALNSSRLQWRLPLQQKVLQPGEEVRTEMAFRALGLSFVDRLRFEMRCSPAPGQVQELGCTLPVHLLKWAVPHPVDQGAFDDLFGRLHPLPPLLIDLDANKAASASAVPDTLKRRLGFYIRPAEPPEGADAALYGAALLGQVQPVMLRAELHGAHLRLSVAASSEHQAQAARFIVLSFLLP
eukprot:TRINITY_DN8159_c1_g5_i1.p1 TRINITY_DN8159_c1_g5~~TRINITY_DN8159_c1_g5_i1.p1  ORF type:complete len:947 (+),score=254.43 TRINITY_DN8159_c1_g5_i1:88-2928(+)